MMAVRVRVDVAVVRRRTQLILPANTTRGSSVFRRFCIQESVAQLGWLQYGPHLCDDWLSNVYMEVSSSTMFPIPV